MSVLPRPAGPCGLLADVGDAAGAQALYRWLERRRADGGLPDVEELVPGARSVLVLAAATATGRTTLRGLARLLPTWSAPPPVSDDAPLTMLPVRYDGPDLATLAEHAGLGVAEVVALHAQAEYTVAFCGFAPGFAYLTGLPARLHAPRLATPRPRVPAGSVGVAGEFTGVYPRSSPGGWLLLGQTSAALWDADREPAALLAPGHRVRFEPASP